MSELTERQTVARDRRPGGGALRSLRHTPFRRFWCGVGLSHIAYDVQRVGLGVLAYDLTGSALALALVLAGDALPMVLLTPVGGAVSDRIDRRRLMAGTRIVLAVLALAIAVLTATGVIVVWHLALYALVTGVCYSFDVPARQAMIHGLVPDSDFINAVALTTALRQAARVVGPLIGSGVLLAAGIPAAFVVMALGQAGFVVLLALVHFPPQSPAAARRTGAMLREGMQFVGRQETVWVLLIIAAIPAVFGMAYQSLIPVFARDILDQPRAAVGLMLTAAGSGALTGSALVAAFPERLGRPAAAVVAAVCFGLLVTAFAASRNYALSLTLLAMAGAASTVVVVITTTAIQRRTPPALHGRVMGVYQVTWEMQVCGALMVGALADVIGAPRALALAGVACAGLTMALVAARPAAWREPAPPEDAITAR